MQISQIKNNLRWSIFVFSFLCLTSSAVYVMADEASTLDTVTFNDTDADGLSNEEEKTFGTDPDVADTDNDGYSDGVEIEGGFDPLKPAPGDRVMLDDKSELVAGGAGISENNLTSQATDALVEVIANKAEGESITSDDLNSVMGSVVSASQEEIVLPEVDTSSLKVKKVSSKLSDEEKKDATRDDITQYLTLVSYILISNAPTPIKDENTLKSFIESAGNQIVVSLLSGDYSFLDTMEERSRKALDEINGVEVPESMIGTHVKAIKLLTFSSNLKKSIQATVSPDDPLGQMFMFAKAQGFLMSLSGFMNETQGMLTDVGVKNIPLDI